MPAKPMNVLRFPPPAAPPAPAPSPRQVLVDLLAAIDAGTVAPENMVIAYYEEIDGKWVASTWQSGASIFEQVGMLDYAKHRLMLCAVEESRG